MNMKKLVVTFDIRLEFDVSEDVDDLSYAFDMVKETLDQCRMYGEVKNYDLNVITLDDQLDVITLDDQLDVK